MAVLPLLSSSEVKEEKKVTFIDLPESDKRQISLKPQKQHRKRSVIFQGTTLLLLLSVLTVVASTLACYRKGHQKEILSWKPGPGLRSLSEGQKNENDEDTFLSRLVMECLDLQDEIGYTFPESPPLTKEEAIPLIVASMKQLERDLGSSPPSTEASFTAPSHSLYTGGLPEQNFPFSQRLVPRTSEPYKQHWVPSGYSLLMASPVGLTSPAQPSLPAQARTTFLSQQKSFIVSGQQEGFSNVRREGKRGGDGSGAALQQSLKRQKSGSTNTTKGEKGALPHERKAKRGTPRKKKTENLEKGDVLPSSEGLANHHFVGSSESSTSEGGSIIPSPPLSPHSFLEFLKAPPESLPSSPEPSDESEEQRPLPNATTVAPSAALNIKQGFTTSRTSPQSLSLSSHPSSSNNNRRPPSTLGTSAAPSALLSFRIVSKTPKTSPESFLTSSKPSSLPLSVSVASPLSPPLSPDSFYEFLKAAPESLPSSPESTSGDSQEPSGSFVAQPSFSSRLPFSANRDLDMQKGKQK